MEHPFKCYISVSGPTDESELLRTLEKTVPGLHRFKGNSFSKTLHLYQPDLEATIQLNGFEAGSPFELKIAIYVSPDPEKSYLALREQVLQTLQATIWNAEVFSIWVDYNAHGINLYTGELFEPYLFAEYPDCPSVQAACRKMIDEEIADRAQPGVTVEQIIETYADHGVNPRIVHKDGSDSACVFPAAEYAKQRARELAGDLWNPNDTKSRGYSDNADTTLSSSEILNRVRSIDESRQFGGLLTSGGIDCIMRLDDGESNRFFRQASQGPVEVSVILPKGFGYPTEERRWDRAAALLDPRPPHERVVDALKEAAETGDGRVDLSYRSLTAVPADLWISFPGMTALSLEGNWLKSLPPDIRRLTKLKSLDLAHNRLSALPPEIGELRSLERLDVSLNGLSTVPDEVCRLTELRRLILSFNKLTAVPPAIWRLSNLVALRLDHNRLTSIPVQVCHLKKLDRLKLQHNRLGSLPLEFGGLKNLKDSHEIFAATKKFHPPSPDELSALDASVNPIGGDLPSLSGSKLRNHLAEQLKPRVAAVPWQPVYSEPFAFGVRMPAAPVETLFEGPPQTLQFKVQFNQCLFSVAGRKLPQPLDPATLPQALEQMESQYAEQWSKPVTRSQCMLGRLPGVEYVVETPAGVLRLRTYLSPTHLYQVQVEGQLEYAFAGESDYFLDSLRPVEWKDYKYEYRICLGVVEDESFILRRLLEALPAFQWSEGDSAWDKIRVSGVGGNTSIRVYRYEGPGPFELTIAIRARERFDDPDHNAVILRGRVLEALRATIWKPLQPQPVTLAKLSCGHFPAAYCFDSDLSRQGIQTLLEDAGFWSWEAKLNHLEGRFPFQLNGKVTWAHKERVKISGERPHYRIEVAWWRNEHGRVPTYEQIHEIVQNTLLPAIKARNVTCATP